MNEQLLSRIRADFGEANFEVAKKALLTVTLSHVMGQSQFNLDNTWSAILQLSNGNLQELRKWVAIAKLDFRDVIYAANHAE